MSEQKGLLRSYESAVALVQRLADASLLVAAEAVAAWLHQQP